MKECCLECPMNTLVAVVLNNYITFMSCSASFMTKTVQYHNELHKFLIWDTAGQERVNTFIRIEIKYGNAVMQCPLLLTGRYVSLCFKLFCVWFILYW